MNVQKDSVVVWFLVSLTAILLVCAVFRNGREWLPSVPDFLPPLRPPIRELSTFSLILLVVALVFAGVVDLIGWSIDPDQPSVSDLIHYHLYLRPWIGWIVAGLVYHLLIDHPAPPLH